MAQHRHKRDTNARKPRAIYVAAPIATVATLSAVTMGVLSASPVSPAADLLAQSATGAVAHSPALTERREIMVSRSQVRTALRTGERAAEREENREDARATRRAIRNADTKLWTTADLNLWDGPGKNAKKIGLVEAIEKVLVTGRREAGRAEIVIDGKARWVTSDYLSAEKPEEGPSLGGTCTNGSSVSVGRASLSKIHEVVCANWPEVTSYGTWRSDGEHGQGRAIDIMVSGQTGWEIAEFLRANYAELGIEYLIYAQKIWSVERGGEGWRGMSNRGSATANHYDHVHVTVW